MEQTKHAVSPLLEHLFTFTHFPASKSKKSMWAAALSFVAENDVEPDKFEDFVRTQGGISKAAIAARAPKLTKLERLQAAREASEAEMHFLLSIASTSPLI